MLRQFDEKGNPKIAAALRELGVGSDLSDAKRIEVLTQALAELRVQVADLAERLAEAGT
jgi:polyhydroxyalkanoate synthesis regulator phasin